ncbi:MAG: DUF1080 domain-containing protein [Mangrovibacterium sp.]|nr:DUF1080 domain-containing protein [Mangrovibacterium sp.]
MMKQLALFAFTLLAAVSCQPKQNVLTDEEKAEGWTLLFDGATLDGWRDFNGDSLTGPWIVERGTIKAEGHGDDANGYIVTDKPYENFILSWDWKISKGGNSGMLYHVLEGERFKVPYVTGPEYQLIDDANFPEPLEPWQKCGADYAMYLPDTSRLHVNPAGEWNTSKIVFDNGHVEYWMNGEKIIEFEAWTPDWFARKNSGKWEDAPEYGLSPTGLLCLQDHGYPAWFRNIKIRGLPKKDKAPVSLFNGKDLSGWIVYGTEKWYVEDSLLVCESGPDKAYGYLGTERYFKDFDLSVDFKQLANGNSGIFFRSTVDGTKVAGWQVEVAPKDHDSGGIYESYGRGWLHQIPDPLENVLKPGEWNTMRIKVTGPEVTTWLNGTEMTKLSDPKIGQANGRIALQIHDGGGIKVQWKNLIVKEL